MRAEEGGGGYCRSEGKAKEGKVGDQVSTSSFDRWPADKAVLL